MPVSEAAAAQIEIIFGQGYHNCPLNIEFDGEGGMLAHAIWPFEHQEGRGDIHLDTQEPWDIDQKGRLNDISILGH